MEKRYYIAYGSNLNVRQMIRRCPEARVIGTGTLEGWELLFKGSKTGSYLTIEQSPDGLVPVAVWEVSERDERNLDVYEGYPNFYYKKEMTIHFRGIKTGRIRKRRVFGYIMFSTSNTFCKISISVDKRITLLSKLLTVFLLTGSFSESL